MLHLPIFPWRPKMRRVTQKADFSVILTLQYSLHIFLNAGSWWTYPCHVFTGLGLFSSYSSRQFQMYFLLLDPIVLICVAGCLFLCFSTFPLFDKESHPNPLNLPMILPSIPQEKKVQNVQTFLEPRETSIMRNTGAKYCCLPMHSKCINRLQNGDEFRLNRQLCRFADDRPLDSQERIRRFKHGFTSQDTSPTFLQKLVQLCINVKGTFPSCDYLCNQQEKNSWWTRLCGSASDHSNLNVGWRKKCHRQPISWKREDLQGHWQGSGSELSQ